MALRVAAVRLILLIGCRPGEIRRLRRCEVKPDRLTLIDAKTGPRHILLGEAANMKSQLSPSFPFSDQVSNDY